MLNPCHDLVEWTIACISATSIPDNRFYSYPMDSFQDKKTRIGLRVRLQPPTSAGNQKASWEAQSKQCFVCVSVEDLERDNNLGNRLSRVGWANVTRKFNW